MNINYFEPLSLAFSRMNKALFKPFDLSRWFIFGFSAFLAGLLDGPGGNFTHGFDSEDYGSGNFWTAPLQAWNWLNDNPIWFILIIIGTLLLICLIVALVWLSSRGAFLFIDNIVTDKAEVSKPWNEYSKEGNSVFIWRIVFGLIVSIVISLFVVFALITVFGFAAGDFSALATISSIFIMGLPFLLIIIVVMYISMFMNNFVIPLMYKERIGALKAWGRFIKLFKQNTVNFILYGLLLFVLHIAVGIGVMIIGFFTCCVGFLFLIIPYVNSVILLPITYTYRSFSLEFFAQFGEEFNLFTKIENL